MTAELSARRPLKVRSSRWAIRFAAMLVRSGVSPNAISLFSIVCAGAACAAYLMAAGAAGTERLLLLLGAAAGIQLRLLCNLFDGMVAVEGGKKTPAGEIYNDLPDRIADPLILIPAGYVVGAWHAPMWSWTAGLLSLFTAYIRVLGGSIGLAQDFSGPMAKQHRMAVLTVGTVAEAAVGPLVRPGVFLFTALAIIVFGSILTCVLRVRRIAAALRSR